MSQQEAVQLDAYQWHEALDRTYICLNLLNQLVVHHAVVVKHPSLQEKVSHAHALLLDACREMARLSIDAGK